VYCEEVEKIIFDDVINEYWVSRSRTTKRVLNMVVYTAKIPS
jgi:hypothetical protein